jgi:hypothetical protein
MDYAVDHSRAVAQTSSALPRLIGAAGVNYPPSLYSSQVAPRVAAVVVAGIPPDPDTVLCCGNLLQ